MGQSDQGWTVFATMANLSFCILYRHKYKYNSRCWEGGCLQLLANLSGPPSNLSILTPPVLCNIDKIHIYKLYQISKENGNIYCCIDLSWHMERDSSSNFLSQFGKTYESHNSCHIFGDLGQGYGAWEHSLKWV